MTIAIFGNTLRLETIREIKHIVEFLQLRGVDIVLSQELRHEAFNREFLSVEDYIAQTGETIDFAAPGTCIASINYQILSQDFSFQFFLYCIECL